jgi:hypothetical protein
MPKSETTIVRSLPQLGRQFSRLYREDEFPRLRWQPAPEGDRVRIEVKGRRRTLTVDPTLHPSRRLLETGHVDDGRLILAPALGEPLARDLRAAGFNHADLNGKLYLNLDDPTLILDRSGVGGRRFANPVSEADAFAPKSNRLLRTLLARRDEIWTQATLSERSGLSRGLVSRLMGALEADGYLKAVTAATRQQAGTWRLMDFDRLLDAWRERDDWVARTQVQEYSVLTGDVHELAGEVRTQLQGELGTGGLAFTQWFAARLKQPYTDSPVVSVYVRQPVEPGLRFARPVSFGGNLWLISPKDDGVFRETQTVAGFPLVSDAQIYLDLLQVSQRGPEQAEVLRKWEGFAR